MSYEGFTEYLCEKGHYFCLHAMEADPVECHHCQRPVAYFHPIDVTNGTDELDSHARPAEKKFVGEEWINRISLGGDPYKIPLPLWEPTEEWKTWRKE